MKKMEILSPAGDFETLKYAIEAGCDSIYFGGKQYGARHYATNFSNEEIIEAIKYCHLRDVRVYIVINTLLSDSQFDSVLEYIDMLYLNNVDAIIIQDIGLLNRIQGRYPGLELHASTQMHIHNKSSIKLAKSLGISRVVLPRELSLKEVNELSQYNVELETFAHGALCYSYSGQCLYSYHIGKRSANKGMCAQSCRLNYTLNNKNKCHMSLKDLNVLENLDKLINSNVSCIKIEGRMKRKEYVYITTSIYRKYLDMYHENGYIDIDPKDIIELKKIFNREFTSGKLFDDNTLSDYPNHIGIPVGKVISVNKYSTTIRLTEDVHQNDGLRIDNEGVVLQAIYLNNKQVKSAVKGDTITIKTKYLFKVGDKVLKTSDYLQLKSVVFKDTRKSPIDITVYEDETQYTFIATNNDYTSSLTVDKEDISPLSNERVLTQLSKTGSTVYKLNSIYHDFDIHLSISTINNVRRNLLSQLDVEKFNKYDRKIIDKKYSSTVNNTNSDKEIYVVVNTKEQYDVVSKYICESNIFTRYKSDNMLYSNTYTNSYKEGLVSELGGIKPGININYTLNVYNSYYIDYLNKRNVNNICLSIETTDNQIKHILKNNPSNNLSILIYGKVLLMTSKNIISNRDTNIIDRVGEKHHILFEENMNKIYSSKPINKILNFSEYLNIGLKKFRIDFLDESTEQVEKIIEKIL